ncbi:heme ABC transporter permease [soil metagenome]
MTLTEAGSATGPTVATQPSAPTGTGSGATRVVGLLALAALAVFGGLALLWSPADQVQGEVVRLMYVHVPAASMMYLCFGLTAVGSAVHLWKHSTFWDLLAGAAAEVGVVFTVLTLVTGSLWGRPTWGVFWTWDARLTSTALLLVLFLGYLAVRRLQAEPAVRARRAAWAGLIAAVDLPIVHFATDWWETLHQGATIARPDPQIDGLMLFTLMFALVTFALLTWWLVMHRFRLQFMEAQLEDQGLDAAIAARHAEASTAEAGTAGSTR